ncbi:hypothetical protein Mpop_1843 [Methylorubrum populi BJ001]|jgi:hypothetical protein|uniref:Uncharacterized protein n=1 Tax=Methylorubrum populi (strain ATCC BAA-705 / NCIMB 13946 / BJ001) TaxID=441620 RepID=B1ZII6_METPB|nr:MULTISPECIES: hypothetical protein [Methylorubrum]ACB80006.1 hypothetical protein Mpop_1843 [Methylorubrum populi BJ001]MBI1691931.1 hypothetical protein [Methylorubrum sp. DB1722]
MTRPTNSLDTRLTVLSDVAGQAALLPDVPEARLAELREIRAWVHTHPRVLAPSLPKPGTPEANAIDAGIRARHEFIEQDRRCRVVVGTHRQSTEADGSGPAPGPDWPHHW